MQLLVSDANILIDLEEGGILATFFELPYEFTVPDILFVEELEEQHAYLIDMGLVVRELSGDTMRYVFSLIQKARGPSRHDCFAIALAKQENCPLLSGDKDLRRRLVITFQILIKRPNKYFAHLKKATRLFKLFDNAQVTKAGSLVCFFRRFISPSMVWKLIEPT